MSLGKGLHSQINVTYACVVFVFWRFQIYIKYIVRVLKSHKVKVFLNVLIPAFHKHLPQNQFSKELPFDQWFSNCGSGPSNTSVTWALLGMQLLGSTPTLCIQTLGGRPSRMCDSKSNKRCSLQLNCEKHWQKILLLLSNSAAPFSLLGFLLMIFFMTL